MKLLLFIVATLGLIQLATGAASKCYGCEVIGCGDSFDKSAVGVVTVPSTSGYCLKIKADEGVVSVVMRSAGDGVCSSNGCTKQSAQGATSTICCCDSDFCNGASTLSRNFVVTIVSLLMTLGFFKLHY